MELKTIGRTRFFTDKISKLVLWILCIFWILNSKNIYRYSSFSMLCTNIKTKHFKSKVKYGNIVKGSNYIIFIISGDVFQIIPFVWNLFFHFIDTLTMILYISVTRYTSNKMFSTFSLVTSCEITQEIVPQISWRSTWRYQLLIQVSRISKTFNFLNANSE